MEAGNAPEPVVVWAMERAGWKVDAADPNDPQQVAVRICPNPVSGTGQAMVVTGHPDATGRMPVDGDDTTAELQTLLFGGAAPA